MDQFLLLETLNRFLVGRIKKQRIQGDRNGAGKTYAPGEKSS